ncbi:hypothetical protein NliqN6_4293 [Naganishia liquefaciens]|uniref:Uncharacterized protein n=1 Tax=Naganishia liquefaciens TaxID=104408 RepID=A0A8H3TVV6_9TREE|nr:hypothetical protein NliqN6_4293 [Naganishia liquefaciens]
MLIYSNIRPQPIKADSQPDKRRQMSHPASARHSAAQEMDRQVDRSWHEAAVSSPPRDPLTQTPPAMPFNYSLYTIPVAWVLASSPQGYAMWTFNAFKAPGAKGWNNAQPRSNLTPESFKSNQIPANVAARILRAHEALFPLSCLFLVPRTERASSASSNGLENLALYAAGVVVANYARIAPETLNTLSVPIIALGCERSLIP